MIMENRFECFESTQLTIEATVAICGGNPTEVTAIVVENDYIIF